MKHNALIAIAFAAMAASCGQSAKQPEQQAENQEKILKEVYADAFRIGTSVSRFEIGGRSSKSQEILLKHFNAVSPENDMKPEVIHPNPNTWNFSGADAYIEFGKKNNMWILGHTLCWHNQTPDFFWNDEKGNPKTKQQLFDTIEDYIKVVCTHFLGKVDAWDVINEIVSEDGGYRDLGWVKALGGNQADVDEFVKHVFRCAQKYAPDTELYYNEFNAWRPSKMAGILRIVDMLRAEGIRIDGVGIQGHWGLNFPKNEYIEQAIDTYAAHGLRVNITELDVDVLPVSKEGQVFGWEGLKNSLYQLEEWETFLDPYKEGLPDEVEEQQAARYAELLAIFYKHRDQIDRVTWWGISDGISWKNGYPVLNRVNYPLLWKRDFTPHKSLQRVLDVPSQAGK